MIKRNWRFWAFILGIVMVSCITLWTNNYSDVKMDAIVEESIENVKPIEEMFQTAQADFIRMNEVMGALLDGREDVFYDEDLLNITEIEINSMLEEYTENREMVRGCFYRLDDGRKGESIGGAVNLEGVGNLEDVRSRLEEEDGKVWLAWVSEEADEGKARLSYILSIRQNGKPIGFMGMEVDMEYVAKELELSLPDGDGRLLTLLSGEGDVLYRPDSSVLLSEANMDEGEYYEVADRLRNVQGKGWVLYKRNGERYLYSYKRFSTGQVYIAVQRVFKKVRQSNLLILLIASVAIVNVTFTKKGVNGKKKSVIERITNRIMRRYRDKLTPQNVKGQQSVILLHIAMAGAVLTDAVYSFVLGKEAGFILEYVLYFLFILTLMLFYTHSKKGLTNRTAFVVAILGMTFPVVEHIMAGGFDAGRAGDGLLWLIVALFVSLFILGEEKSIDIFNLFVVVLFLDLLAEIFLLRAYEYERIYNFVTSFFFLGLACFASMGIYVSDSQKAYQKEEALIRQLEANQSLLIKKEKMSTLGQLISGVAHDINTPIGAIKASIETMEASFEKLLWTLMRAGQKWEDSDYECFEQLIVLSLYAKAQMKTTKEIREGRKGLIKYLESEGVNNAPELAKLLAKLEIVDVAHLEPCLFLFYKENIGEIIKEVTELSAFLSGIPTTVYAAERVGDIVKALKAYVHTNVEGVDVEYDVKRSIDTVLVLYHSQLKSSLEVETEYDEDLPLLYGNPDEMAQVWTNLVQNAIYEMKEKGGTLKITVKREKEGVEVVFSDTGDGIPDSIKDKIFTPFFTTKAVGDGSGLGLNIVKGVIERYGGTISVESVEGRGTKFLIYLPGGSRRQSGKE